MQTAASRAAAMLVALGLGACATIAGLESGELAPSTGGAGGVGAGGSGGAGGTQSGGTGGTNAGGTSSGGTSAGGTNAGGTSGGTGGVAGGGGAAGSGGSKYAQAVLADAPIAYWRLGEATTPVAEDSSGNGHQATYKGVSVGQPVAIVGDPDTCAYFDGQFGGMVDAGNDFGFAPNSPFSLELWYKPEDIEKGLAGKDSYDTAYHGWMLVENKNSVIEFYRLPGSAIAPAPPRNVWTHVVASFDGFTLALYLNGQQAASHADADTLESTTESFVIGEATQWGFFKGSIDEVALYDKPLGPARVLAHYKIGSGT